jgi:hypothetical protein
MENNELENTILRRNQVHARQSLYTPFATQPNLSQAIDHTNPRNKIQQILEGTFLDENHNIPLSTAEQQWINELKQGISEPMNTHITLHDFIHFLKQQKEKTASSFSKRHLGHYKAICQLAQGGNTTIAETLIILINISISTSTPLTRWQQCLQIMLEKGKGNCIDHL